MILLHGGWALCDKETDQILSFAMFNDHLATGLLTTVEGARGKKYGEMMAKLMSIKIVEIFNLHPICFINNLNVPSINLYGKLGYEKIGGSNWIVVGDW